MNPIKSAARIQATAIATAIAVTGCFPNKKTDVRVNTDPGVAQATYAVQTRPGQLIAPKRCGLSFASIARDANDPAINELLWRATDEQVIPAATYRTLQTNGLRVGVITGSLPVELEKILKPTDPQAKKVDIVQVDVMDGDSSSVSLCSASEPITLLINREGKTIGKQYDEAKGLVRITASHDGSGGVKLKLVPLIQYGPTKKGFGAAPAGAFQPQEFIVKDGQAEEPFRDLAATISLKPGQVLAIGGKTDSALSLGGFLFSQIDSANEKSEQRVILVWAQPSAAISVNSSPARSFLNWAEKPKDAPAKLQLPFEKLTTVPGTDTTDADTTKSAPLGTKGKP